MRCTQRLLFLSSSAWWTREFIVDCHDFIYSKGSHTFFFCLSSLMLQVLLTLMETNFSLMNVFDWFKRHNLPSFLSQFAKEPGAICSFFTLRCCDVEVLCTLSRQTTSQLCPTSYIVHKR